MHPTPPLVNYVPPAILDSTALVGKAADNCTPTDAAAHSARNRGIWPSSPRVDVPAAVRIRFRAAPALGIPDVNWAASLLDGTIGLDHARAGGERRAVRPRGQGLECRGRRSPPTPRRCARSAALAAEASFRALMVADQAPDRAGVVVIRRRGTQMGRMSILVALAHGGQYAARPTAHPKVHPARWAVRISTHGLVITKEPPGIATIAPLVPSLSPASAPRPAPGDDPSPQLRDVT